MDTLSKRIDNFIEKRAKVLSASKIPPPKLSGRRQRRVSYRPPSLTSPTKKKPEQDKDIFPEIGRQLTPLGPYRAVSDVARDVRESERLARKITGIKKPGIGIVKPDE